MEELEICHCIPEFGYGSVAGLWFTSEGDVWVEVLVLKDELILRLSWMYFSFKIYMDFKW